MASTQSTIPIGVTRSSQPIPKGPTDTPLSSSHLYIRIRNRERIIFEGEVKALSSYNDKGNFDILGKHANFICLIKNFITIHKLDGTKEEIKIDNGLIQVVANQVLVFIGIVNLSFLSQELNQPSQQNPVQQTVLAKK